MFLLILSCIMQWFDLVLLCWPSFWLTGYHCFFWFCFCFWVLPRLWADQSCFILFFNLFLILLETVIGLHHRLTSKPNLAQKFQWVWLWFHTQRILDQVWSGWGTSLWIGVRVPNPKKCSENFCIQASFSQNPYLPPRRRYHRDDEKTHLSPTSIVW